MSIWSNHRGEFIECGNIAQTVSSSVDAAFVVTAVRVLDELVTHG